jgi:hypothetical protein
MYKAKLFLLIICCAAAYGAMAQQMYKTVGPDGKVTFSDRPQLDDKAKLSVMKSYTLRAVEPPKPKVEPLAAKPGRKAGPGEPQVVLTAEVEEAMVSVMGMVEFGLRFEPFCNSNPAEARAFAAANYDWKKRNAAAIEQQKRLLTEAISPIKRAHLLDTQQQLMSEEIAKVVARDAAARKEWCAGVVAELNSGRSDVDKPAMMALPIVPYRAK